MLLARTITVLIGIPLVLFFIFNSAFYDLPFFGFLLVLNGIAQLELLKIFSIKKVKINKLFFLLSGLLIIACFYLSSMFLKQLPFLYIVAFIILVFVYFSSLIFQNNYDKVIDKIAYFTFGLFYLPFLIGHFIFLKNLPQGKYLLFLIILLIWFNDIFAYIFGMAFGKKKLNLKASPNKSYIGLIGGSAFAIIAVFITAAIFSDKIHFSIIQKIIIGIIFSLFADISDLLESILKRSSQIKDSNTLLPGHGGILDRFDSWFITIPAFYYFLVLIG